MTVSNTHLVTSPHAIGSRIVRCALIQTGGMMSPADIIQRQVALVKEAAKKGAQVICLQELATGPYFCQVEQREWFSLAEPVPTGDSTQLMMSLARELGVDITQVTGSEKDGRVVEDDIKKFVSTKFLR